MNETEKKSSQNDQSAAAFFDVDGTIVSTNIVHYYVRFRRATLSNIAWFFWVTAFIPKVIYYFFLDKISRTAFNKVFYRDYRGMDAELLRSLADQEFNTFIRFKVFPSAIAQIHRHLDRGDRVVLATGSLDFIIDPLASYLGIKDLVCAKMTTDQNGKLTGDLTTEPIGGDQKAWAVHRFAKENGIDLNRSFAYGDSIADLPMLQSVRNPIAINPDPKLRKFAEKYNLPIEEWKN